MTRLTIDQAEHTKKQAIADLATVNREQFRRDGSRAATLFTPYERKLVDDLRIKDSDRYDIFSAWEDELRPLLRTLEQHRTKPSFHKTLTKQLLLDENSNDSINRIVTMRTCEIVDEFVKKIYSTDRASKKKRLLAAQVFSWTDREINRLKNHYVDYVLYDEIAKTHGIYLYDSHAFIGKRLSTKLRIRRERRMTKANEKKRLKYLHRRLRELRTVNNGLIGDMLDKKLDMISILSLRNQYEKALSDLSEKDAGNAARRLAVFDTVTAPFKEKYALSHSEATHQVSLEGARIDAVELDTILLKTFDLSVIQKNQLLLSSKEYREAVQEIDDIKRIRRERSYLKKH